MITLFTIGFTKKNAEKFFTLLRNAGVKRLLDIRLNNSSQLAGFAKKDDLAFLVRELCHADYLHLEQLAPTQEILDAFKKAKGEWVVFERAFNQLISTRHIENTVTPELLDHGCLLCSEETPEHCHRRLVGEYLQKHIPNLQVVHLQ